MVEREGLKKIRGKEQQRFTLFSDAEKYAKEQAEKEKCRYINATDIHWIRINKPRKKKVEAEGSKSTDLTLKK